VDSGYPRRRLFGLDIEEWRRVENGGEGFAYWGELVQKRKVRLANRGYDHV
jgi:hypothetical protein